MSPLDREKKYFHLFDLRFSEFSFIFLWIPKNISCGFLPERLLLYCVSLTAVGAEFSSVFSFAFGILETYVFVFVIPFSLEKNKKRVGKIAEFSVFPAFSGVAHAKYQTYFTEPCGPGFQHQCVLHLMTATNYTVSFHFSNALGCGIQQRIFCSSVGSR